MDDRRDPTWHFVGHYWLTSTPNRTRSVQRCLNSVLCSSPRYHLPHISVISQRLNDLSYLLLAINLCTNTLQGRLMPPLHLRVYLVTEHASMRSSYAHSLPYLNYPGMEIFHPQPTHQDPTSHLPSTYGPGGHPESLPVLARNSWRPLESLREHPQGLSAFRQL